LLVQLTTRVKRGARSASTGQSIAGLGQRLTAASIAFDNGDLAFACDHKASGAIGHAFDSSGAWLGRMLRGLSNGDGELGKVMLSSLQASALALHLMSNAAKSVARDVVKACFGCHPPLPRKFP